LSNVEEIKERIEAKRKARSDKAGEQAVKDWEAYEAACETHGYDACSRLIFPRFVEGLPTFAVVHAAPSDLVRIHRQRIIKGKRDKQGNPDPAVAGNAAREVGRACLAYPEADMLDAVREQYPDFEMDAGVAALQLSRVQAEEEGKE